MKLGDGASLVVLDDGAKHDVPCTVTGVGPLQVTPNGWLGQHHITLMQFLLNLREQRDLHPVELEYWAQQWVAVAATELVDQLWQVYAKEAGLGTATLPSGGELPGTSR